MNNEQEQTVQALKMAIQMEIDGKEFYTMASNECKDLMGKKLLETLAEEEDYHRAKFEQIFKSIQDNSRWQVTDFKADGGQKLRTIFAQATDGENMTIEIGATELENVQKAMEMENKSYDLYVTQSKVAEFGALKEFYNKIAAEEREHFIVLQDYYEYLKDPAAYFVKTEHPSLDG